MEEILINSETDTFLIHVAQLDKVEYTHDMESRLEFLRRDKVSRPLILVSMGTASQVAGSAGSLAAIRRYRDDRNGDIEIVQTGCLGISLLEPVISIQMPGKNRLLFSNITEDKVVSLLDDVFHNNIPRELCMAQLRSEKTEGFKDIPFLEELDYMKFQKRVILKSCGLSNPDSIYCSRWFQIICKNDQKLHIRRNLRYN
jgi:hypothetical protein